MADHLNAEMQHNILDTYIAKGNTKQLFKVWHYIFNKESEYSVNTEIGINKYKKFKQNHLLIQAHNAKNLSWKEGLNQFSDMDEVETKVFLGVRDRTPEEMKDYLTQLTGKFDLDSYKDDDDVDPPKVEREKVDWTSVLSPIRNQGGCGSCYAFSVQAAIEGNYVKNRRSEGKMKSETITLSTQQIVDCSQGTFGCEGGWMWYAMDYLKTSGIALESKYSYSASRNSCQYSSSKASPVKITGYEYAGKSNYTADTVYTLLKKGPLTNCVDINGLMRYRSGIAELACTSVCPHAVNTVAWGTSDGKNFLKFRNSWGTSWGEAGYARVAQNYANASSCMLEYPPFTLRPLVN
jgi:C1A family cysteine protease